MADLVRDGVFDEAFGRRPLGEEVAAGLRQELGERAEAGKPCLARLVCVSRQGAVVGAPVGPFDRVQ